MEKSIWIDLTRTLHSGMPVYPGDPPVKIEPLHTVKEDHYNMNRLSTAMHAGTHLDAPLHFLEEGMDSAAIPLEQVAGAANLIRVRPLNGVIRTADLRNAHAALKEKHPRLLVSTGWEKTVESDYFRGYPGFEPDLPAFLQENAIVLLGFDLPSLEFPQEGPVSAHRQVLGKNIIIVESLIHLDQLPEAFFFVGMPLKISGMDGSLIRAAARSISRDFSD